VLFRSGGVRREKPQRVVAPVVAQPEADEALLVEMGMRRQQFDRGNAERQQVFDHRLRSQAGIRAAKLRRHVGVELRQALDLRFVDQRVAPRLRIEPLPSTRRPVG